jgi:uncharacterized protein (DUF488 family)
MEIFTIGFTQKTAQEFFGILRVNRIQRLLDIRLNNVSQLAGFTKREDLAFFLREICAAEYDHELQLAPTQELLSDYKKGKCVWDEYESRFLDLIRERAIERHFNPNSFEVRTVLLCSEPTAEKCHRRLVAEYLRDHLNGLTVTHL